MSENYTPRLKARYRAEIRENLQKEFSFDNVMQIPGVTKVVVNMGVGEFLDRLLTVALPRIRDFRGLSDKQFDGHGNYTFGLSEQSMFYEIDIDKMDRPRGMDITVVTTATNNDEGRALLRELGFPFKTAQHKD